MRTTRFKATFLLCFAMLLCASIGAIMPLCSGCQTPTQYKQVAAQTESGVDQAELYLLMADQFTEQMLAAGIIDSNQAAKIYKVLSEANDVAPKVLAATQAVQANNYSAESADNPVLAAVETAQVVNAATAPWNPYSVLIGGILSLVGVVVGAFGIGKKKEK